jgi:amino acid transporter
VVASYAVSSISAVASALCYAECAVDFPIAGGGYGFVSLTMATSLAGRLRCIHGPVASQVQPEVGPALCCICSVSSMSTFLQDRGRQLAVWVLRVGCRCRAQLHTVLEPAVQQLCQRSWSEAAVQITVCKCTNVAHLPAQEHSRSTTSAMSHGHATASEFLFLPCCDLSGLVFHKGGWTVDFVAAGLVVLLSLLVVYGAQEGSLFNIGDHSQTAFCLAQRRGALVTIIAVTTTPSSSKIAWSNCSADGTHGTARARQGRAEQSCQPQSHLDLAGWHSTRESD